MRMFVFKKINKISNIKHGFFSRNGGLSKGIYRSLNCGINSKDKKGTILKNRKIALKKLGLEKKKLIIPHQTHSNIVKIVDENTPIIAVVHDVQVVNFDLEPSDTDIIVDWIITNKQKLSTNRNKSRPSGIYWNLLENGMLEATPPLRELKKILDKK